jgi:hypothetical protein
MHEMWIAVAGRYQPLAVTQCKTPCRMCRVRVMFGKPMAHFCCVRSARDFGRNVVGGPR